MKIRLFHRLPYLVAAWTSLALPVSGAPGATSVRTNSAGDIVAVRYGDRETPPSGAAPRAYREGELLVRFKPSLPESAKKEKHARNRTTLLREHRRLRLHHLSLPADLPVPEALARYRRDPDVQYAEPNYLLNLANTPDDPRLDELWGLASIQAPAAWDLTAGDGSAVIAVLDTGIDYTHPDLVPNLWVNQGELNGLPGADNDGNGYLGDLHGYNAIKRSGDPRDDHFHGTHVAGTIAAAGNNGTGVVGVAWHAKILACKFLDANGSGTVEDAIACLEYVKGMKERGVNIVATNNSWGTPFYSQSLYDAIRDQLDILFVAAAGNDNVKAPSYPAGFDLPNIISVAASDQADRKASFSNYGKGIVHVAAPGSDILSTVPGQAYGTLSGTSMATPHVAGLAALLKSQDPGRGAAVLRNLILSGADPIPSLADSSVTGARIDAYQSLSCTNRPLFALLHPPADPRTGVPQTVSALSVNCGTPVGPVTLTLSGGGVIALSDDGVPPDLAAGDGVFTGTWIPATLPEALSFASPLGSAAVSSPPVVISDQPAVPAPAQVLPGSVTAAASGLPFSQSFPSTGGIPPFTWSLARGSLPPGLVLDRLTGEISGTPGTIGDFGFTIEVSDRLGTKDTREWTVLVNQGLRSGWPRELELRQGTGMLPLSSSPVLADLDGDGTDEVIVSDLDTLYVFYLDGSLRKVVLGGGVSTPAVADLDGDGRKEIVVSVSNCYTSSNTLYAYHFDLTPVAGFPAGPYQSYNGGTGYVSPPVIGDLLAGGERTVAAVAAPNNTNDPNFGKSTLILVNARGESLPGGGGFFGKNIPGAPPAPALAELDGGGEKELVVASGDGVLRIFRGDGTLRSQWSYGSCEQTGWSPLVADLDGDGIPEILLRYRSSDSPYLIGAFDRNGRLLPGWPRALPGEVVPISPILADLDGDGHPEVIAVAGNFWDEIHALRADGSEPAGWPVRTGYETGYPWFDCTPVAADLDGDGTQDIVIGGMNSSGTGMLLAFSADGVPFPGFPKYVSAKSEIRSSAAVGDLDGNGKLDLVLKSENGLLHAWEMPQAQEVKDLQWPMLRGGALHPGSWLAGPAAVLSGVPAGSSNAAGAAIGVGGAGLVAYRWRLDGGAYSAEQPVSEPIVVSLGEGRHTLSVVGKNGSGKWQGRPSSASWLVDLTPPATVPLPGPGGIPLYGAVALSCSDPGGSGCAGIRYCLGAGCTPKLPYSAPVPVQGPTELRYFSTDLAGNDEPIRSAAYGAQGQAYRLGLAFAGSGQGVVTGTPAVISARAGTFAWLAEGSELELHAAAAPYSVFTGWTGACSGATDCRLLMTADQSVTAFFERDCAHSTYIPRAPGVFSPDLEAAYRAARDGESIWLWGVEFEGEVRFTEGKEVTISGGYDEGYASRPGVTVLRGMLRISGGKAKVDRLMLR